MLSTVGSLVNSGLSPTINTTSLQNVVSLTGKAVPGDISGLSSIRIFPNEISEIQSLYAVRAAQINLLYIQKTIDTTSLQVNYYISKIGTDTSSGVVNSDYAL